MPSAHHEYSCVAYDDANGNNDEVPREGRIPKKKKQGGSRKCKKKNFVLLAILHLICTRYACFANWFQSIYIYGTHSLAHPVFAIIEQLLLGSPDEDEKQAEILSEMKIRKNTLTSDK